MDLRAQLKAHVLYGRKIWRAATKYSQYGNGELTNCITVFVLFTRVEVVNEFGTFEIGTQYRMPFFN